MNVLSTHTNSSSKNPMQPYSSSSSSSSLHYSSLSTKVPDSLLRMLYDMLLPHQLGDLSLTCKALHASVDDAIRQKSVQQAQEKSKHAEVLANGGFRLYTRLCRSTVEIKVILLPGMSYYIGERPLLSMRHEGVYYIGKGTQLFLSERLKHHTVHNIFTAGWPLHARSARIHSIDHVLDREEPNTVLTDVCIGVKDTAADDDVEYFATISFATVSW
jgi:hypothetical protein